MAEAWFLSGTVHPEAVADSGGDRDLLWIFDLLDQTGMTWREYENEPILINRLRHEWYIGRSRAQQKKNASPRS